MATEIRQNPTSKFKCIDCDYYTSRKNHYDEHLLTDKHKRQQKSTFSNQNRQKPTTPFTCGCGKKYKDRSGLWRHAKKCNIEVTNHNISNNDLPDKELIMFLIKQNTEIVKENVEFKQLIIDQNKQMIELSKNVGNNNNNVTNKNKFNLNFFLNETCKDAMNLTDFVSSIKLQLQDLENVGKNGYVSGISNIIVKNLNALEINKRPVHCSDLKREIMYVKDENKWEKEKNEKQKLTKAINKVSYKNVLQIPTWQKEHPGCEYSHNKKNDEYLQIVNESMGAFTPEENAENINKIIKNVAKEVMIEKEAD
jgi:hypothetical protein